MSKKHYIAMAAAVREIADVIERRRMAERVAAVCAADNPRFNRARFLAACGVSE